MARLIDKNSTRIDIDTVGGIKEVDLYDVRASFYINPSASPLTLAGSWSITPKLTQGAVPEGAYLEISNPGNIILGAFNLSIFGFSLTAQQALTKGTLKLYYNGSAWEGSYEFDADVVARMSKDFFIIDVSFEAGEKCNNTIIAPCKGRYTKFRTSVIKELAGTDAGTVTPGIGAVGVTGGQVTIAASAPLDEQDEATPTAALSFNEGDTLTFVGAKVTSGGKVRLIAYFDRA